jgi:hypothetical protein
VGAFGRICVKKLALGASHGNLTKRTIQLNKNGRTRSSQVQ